MTNHAPPSSDPADDDSLAGVLRTAFRKFLQSTDDMLPARVVAYSRTKNRATVAPCVAVLTSDGRQVARAQVASVPVMQFGGGGVVLNFNLKPGDLGWIKASDRDISLFMQSYGASTPPNTKRMHTFQDGVFIPEVMRGWAIASEDATHAVLQNLNGNSRVSVGDDFVKLTFGTNYVKLSASGVEINSPALVKITAPNITIDNGSKSIIMNGAGFTLTGNAVIDGTYYSSHKHDDPQGGVTGGPHN